MGISKLNPSAGGIPYGNTAGRPANPGVGRLYSNGELQRLELYTGATYGWQNIVAETPGVTGYSGTVLESNSTSTITITGNNFAAGAIASLIGSNGTEIVATATTVNNLTSITATFGAISGSLDPYDIKVTNPSNLYGVYYDILTVNDYPLWTTSAGLLSTVNAGSSVSIQLSATDEENNTLTYSSSSLPAWLSLNSSTGLLTGTVPTISSNTTYSFNISVTDSVNTAVSRAFSINAVAVPILTGGTLTSDSTYYYRTFTGNGNLVVSGIPASAELLLIAGGGSGSVYGAGGGGGGAGGVVVTSAYSLSTGTYPIVIGAGGTGSTTTQNNGQNTTFNTSTFVAIGGGRGGGKGDIDGAGSGAAGGSGGGAGRDSVANGGASTQTSGSGFTGYGFAGGNSNSSAYGAASGGGGAGAAGGNGPGNGPVGAGGNPGDYAAGAGGQGTILFSSWLTAISSAMSGVSGWSTATSGGRIAGGGGGGAFQVSGNIPAAGGAGGGGAGGIGGDGRGGWSYSVVAGGNGVTNTGSGGGGNINQGGSYVVGPGNGGSGLVVVRYTRASVGG